MKRLIFLGTLVVMATSTFFAQDKIQDRDQDRDQDRIMLVD
jgi:hypothetical protein